MTTTADTTDSALITRQARMSLVVGFAFSQVSGVIARLGIADAFDGEARSPDELAKSTGTDRSSLYRLLRAGIALGLTTAEPDGRFRLTSLGEEFRTGAPAHTVSQLYGDPSIWAAFGALDDAVTTGRPAFEQVHAAGLWQSFDQDPELADRFSAGMALATLVQTPVIVQCCDFSRFQHIVDVGGGDGTLLAAVLAANPGIYGTLSERGTALRAASDRLEAAGVADRCALVEGDFFESVPDWGDAYLLKNILHDWDDAECVRILANCRDAVAGQGATLLIPTLLMPEAVETEDADTALVLAMSDIEMMVLTSGRERTLAEHEELLDRAGLTLGEVIELPGLPHHAVLEVTAAPGPHA